MGSRGRAAALAAVLVTLGFTMSGCTGEDEPERTSGVDPAWYDAVDEAVADADGVGEVPVLSRGSCPLDTPVIAGEELDGSADVGVSTLGDSGHRLICGWSPPATDLVVTRFEDPAELDLAREEVARLGEQDNGANVQTTTAVTVGEREIFVRRTVFPTNDTHIDYAAWYLDDDGGGMVLLDVEAGDERDLIDDYDAQQAAEDLAALLS